jgi:hypothetical protein
MENHFECLWDLFRSIPSVETEGARGSCPGTLAAVHWRVNPHGPSGGNMTQALVA